MLTGIIDAHQHFWDPSRFSYPWMGEKVQVISRPILPGELEPVLCANGVVGTVVVQAISSHEEARWLLSLAYEHAFIAGVVTWCDLRSPYLGAILDELQAHPKFKGVRHQIEDEKVERWMLQEDVIHGFHELARRGIPYDMLVRPRHLQFIPEVCERCPDLQLVVDHIAKPPIAAGLFDDWARDLETVANGSRIWCKLSGLNTEAKWDQWTPADLKPYVQHALGCFGAERTMYGSDWPACLLAGSYTQTMNALKEALGPLSAEDERRIWAENSRQFYRLGE